MKTISAHDKPLSHPGQEWGCAHCKIFSGALSYSKDYKCPTREFHEQVRGRLGGDVRAEERGSCRAGAGAWAWWAGLESREIQGAAAAAAGTVPAQGSEGRRHGHVLRLLFDLHVVGSLAGRCQKVPVSLGEGGGRRGFRRHRLIPSCAAVAQQGALALLRVRGGLVLDLELLEVWPGEVLVAAHVQLQAEVARGRERAQLALERLAPVLVLVHLRREARVTFRPEQAGAGSGASQIGSSDLLDMKWICQIIKQLATSGSTILSTQLMTSFYSSQSCYYF